MRLARGLGLIVVAFVAALALPATAVGVVAGSGVLAGSGTSYTLTLHNAGDQTVACMRFTPPAGVAITAASGPGAVTRDPSGLSFRSQSMSVAAGTDAVFAFMTASAYPANGGGDLRLSADCVADVAASVSGPTPPPPPGLQPVVNRSELASVVSGTVLVRPPGRKDFFKLVGSQLIPDGSEIDTKRGVVRLTLAQPGGGTETADVSEGRAVVDQAAGSPAITTLRLSEKLTGCAPVRSTRAVFIAKRKKRKKRRKLFVSTRGGHVRSEGRYAAAIATGTAWRTTDECRSTTIQVVSGTVRVSDLQRRTSAPLTAPGRRVVRRRT